MHARLALVCCVIVGVASCSSTPVILEPPPISQPIPVASEIEIGGQWSLTVESPMGRENLDASFAQTGEQLTGTLSSAGRDVPIQGTVHGNELRFEMSLEVRGQPLHLNYVGVVDGDTMSGTVQFGPIGTGKFSGTRR